MLSILVCSACKGDLTYDASAQGLTCGACRLRYRVVDDVPNMLVDEAEKF
ncbi:MAG: Trm112 family protein [Candidatus Eiseniibacteriota bacterium]